MKWVLIIGWAGGFVSQTPVETEQLCSIAESSVRLADFDDNVRYIKYIRVAQ